MVTTIQVAAILPVILQGMRCGQLAEQGMCRSDNLSSVEAQ
jgi:hypothetical protein